MVARPRHTAVRARKTLRGLHKVPSSKRGATLTDSHTEAALADGRDRFVPLQGSRVSARGRLPFSFSGNRTPSVNDVVNIQRLKSIFARHGIPDTLVSDNGPQFVSKQFAKFAQSYGFRHVTSSPRHPQANGEAERMVKTIKEILRKAEDPYLSLLAYRNTAGITGLSPAQILMSRRLRTRIPVIQQQLNRAKVDNERLTAANDKIKDRQREVYNRRHNAKLLPQLEAGDEVWVRDANCIGRVVRRASTPRSYIVNTPRGTVRRNRRALVLRTHRDNSTQLTESSSAATERCPGDTFPLRELLDRPERGSRSSSPQAPGSDATGRTPHTVTKSGRRVFAPQRYGMN